MASYGLRTVHKSLYNLIHVYLCSVLTGKSKEVYKHSWIVNGEPIQRWCFESLSMCSQGTSNVLEVTSEDTDIVGVQRSCRTLPEFNEGNFDKECS